MLLLLSRFSRVRLCVTPWTAAQQAPLSTGFSRQEGGSGLPRPSPKKGNAKQQIGKTGYTSENVLRVSVQGSMESPPKYHGMAQ